MCLGNYINLAHEYISSGPFIKMAKYGKLELER